MVPLHWSWLDALPLNANGKLDRKALPVIETGQLQREDHVAPRTELEQTLAAIWAEVLERGAGGVTDNFFELGGHSLLATQIASRVQKTLHAMCRCGRCLNAVASKRWRCTSKACRAVKSTKKRSIA